MQVKTRKVTTALCFRTSTLRGFAALQSLLRLRTRREVAQRALRLLDEIGGQSVISTSPMGRRAALVALKRTPLPEGVGLDDGPVVTWRIPGIAVAWRLGPRSVSGFHVLQRRYGHRTRTGLVGFALEVLRLMAAEELHGHVLQLGDGQRLRVIPTDEGATGE